MLTVLIFLTFFVELFAAQKCSSFYDDKNVFLTVNCVNLRSMVDIADEIRGNWTSITVVNKASHTEFANNAGSA